MKKNLFYGIIMLLTIMSFKPFSNSLYALTIKSIGPAPSDFVSITAALTNLAANPATDPLIWELKSNYVSTVETFPLNFNSTNLSGIDATNTLTIRPAAGATNLSIAGSNTLYIALFSGAQYVTFDGRPGGTGTTSQLTISNTSTSGATIEFLNEGSNNSLLYCTIKGVVSTTLKGVVFFATTNGTNGNDNNTIDHCTITAGTTLPTNLVYSNGTATPTTRYNSNNTISNCNLYDWGLAQNHYAIHIAANSTDWIITGNSIYQTTARVASFEHAGIRILTGSNYSITGNYIGGSAPLCSGGPMTYTSTTTGGTFVAIYMDQTGTPIVPSSIQGNTIQNISLTFSATTVANAGLITLRIGDFDCGNITPNLIGNTTVANSINYVNSGTGATQVYSAINAGGATAGTVNIINNIICGLAFSTSSTGAVTGRGISLAGAAGGVYNVTGNTIGSLTLTNAISNSTAQPLIGLYSTSTSISNNISGNNIANLSQNNTAAANNQLYGMYTPGNNGGAYAITGNTIRNLSSASTLAGSGSGACVIGINATAATTAGQTISQNVLHTFSNSAVSAATNLVGIYYAGPATGTNIVSRNFIHSFGLSTTSTSAALTGIYSGGGATDYQNNMVRLGIDAAGTVINTGYAIYGIYDQTGTNNFYFNSIYLGGTSVSGTTSSTYAFFSNAVTNRNIKNNIFFNNRSGGIIGKHYAIRVAGSTFNPVGLASNYNLLFAPGAIGGTFGFFNGLDLPSLVAWQVATGQDLASGYGDPVYVNATGNSTSLDLHVQASNPIEASGTDVVTVTNDFDGQTRSSLTPVDIGADAGNFTNNGDVFFPMISYSPIPSTFSFSNLVLPAFATITDNMGVSGGASLPRLYYKKASDANAFVGNTNADNGWKYTIATNSTSPYSFVIDYSIINGGSVAMGDIIQYFVVAQDNANNLASYFPGVGASGNPPVQNINVAPGIANVSSYTILTTFSGTYNVPGNFPSLTGVNGLFETINNGKLSGNVIVNITGNLTEDGTNALNLWVEEPVSSNFALTIQPDAAILRTITGNLNNGLIRFNGANRVTIDGRFTGTGNYLEFNNSNTGNSSSTFLLQNDASNNIIRYCNILGASSGISSGVIVFSTTTGITGNDNNLIEFCNIHESATIPVNLVYSLGTSTPTQNNSNNSILNCSLYNFFNATGVAYGVYIGTGNTDWTITGNSIFQTATRTFTTGSTHYGIYLSNTGNNFTVMNNFIGGGAPSCGGTAWTNAGTVASRFVGIYLSVGSIASSIQNNTIANFIWTSASGANTLPGVWGGIFLVSGSANIGTITGNTIGSGTGTGSVAVTISTTGGVSMGIGSTSTLTNSISNNVIGSINVSGNTVGISHSFNGIWNTGSSPSVTISGNTIGSTSTANSIISGNAATVTTAAVVQGIVNSGNSAAISIINNIIANLNSTYLPAVANTSTIVRGIVSTLGANTITGNTIRNLSTGAQATGSGATASVIGISMTATTAPATVSQNIIFDLNNSHASAAVCVTGIHYGGPVTGTNVIARNLVHSLSIVSSSPTADMRGINFASGLASVYNNMIRLGIDADGASLNSGIQITGLYDVLSTAGTGMYFNSVYIGGSGVSVSTAKTYAFRSDPLTTRTYQDNIFFNGRSNSIAAPNHYAVRVAGSGYKTAGLSLNYNAYFANGTGGVFGYYGADVTSLPAWIEATGQDMASGYGDPLFVNSTGNSAVVNLRLQNLTPLESSGINIATVTNDFDGEIRSSLSPVDVGADAGNFTLSSDVFLPMISFNPIPSSFTFSNVILTGFATVTDNVGVSGGANLPRIYYKKASDANAFAGNNSSDNGWKYTVATNSSSPYNFLIDYSIINGGSVIMGDVIQYFVVAQDNANNLGSNYPGATANGNPPVQNINQAPALANVNSYTILTSFTGNINVPGDYPSLTGMGGLFSFINAGRLNGNLTVTITGDMTEDGTNSLNQWIEEPANSNFTLLIRPDGTTIRTITGSVAAGMIRFNGADRVTVDGRYSGSGRYLDFSNTYGTAGGNGSTFSFLNDAVGCTLRNCTLEGACNNAAWGVIVFSTSTGTTGNDNILISDNIIKAIGTQPIHNLIYAFGTAGKLNSSNTISNNEFLNFARSGVYVTGTGNGDNWILSDNSFYYNAAPIPALAQTSIDFVPGTTSNNNLIAGNYIGGQAALCGGSSWLNSGNVSFIGINAVAGNTIPTTISNNNIRNIAMTNTGTSTLFNGITLAAGSGNFIVSGNTIGHASTPNMINLSGGANQTGILCQSSGTSSVLNNTVANLFNSSIVTTAGGTRGIACTNGVMTISSNIVHDITVNTMTSSKNEDATLTGIDYSGNVSGQIIERNLIYNLSNNTSTAGINSVTVQGIRVYQASGYMNRNSVYNLTINNLQSYGTILGLHVASSNWTVANNMVILGSGLTNQLEISGIYTELVGLQYFYFNSVSISGTQTTGTTLYNTYAYKKHYLSAANVNLRNNIFSNTRTGGLGKHYAIGNITVANGSMNSDYNDLYTTVAPLGNWNDVSQNTLLNWQTSSVGDANSKNVTPNFVSTADLHISTNATLDNAGIAVSVTNDFDGLTRCNPPDIGLNEFGTSLVPTITGPDSICQGSIGNIYMTESGKTGYIWTVSSGGTITFGTGTNSITVTWNSGGAQTVSVSYNAGCSSVFPVYNVIVIGNPDPAGPISGSATFTPGTTGIVYSVAAIPNATSYLWSYTGTGVTINGTGTSVTLDFSLATTSGQLRVKGQNACFVGSESFLDINPPNKTLNLTALLEGLYAGSGTMNQAFDATGPHWPAGVADHITVELHDAGTYSTIIYTASSVNLSQSGIATVLVPAAFNASYYITLKHRNSITTVSALPVSFAGSAISYNFTGSNSQAFGSNQKQLGAGIYGIYAGDVNGDGAIDGLDMIGVENDAFVAATGYILTDVNGDGVVDGLDMILVENNSISAISVITP